MKAKFLCFKISKIVGILAIIILMQIVFIIIGIKNLMEVKNFEEMKDEINNITSKTQENQDNKGEYKSIKGQGNKTEIIKDERIEKEINKSIQKDNDENTSKNKTLKKEYGTMPSNIKGYKVIGKIQIPKLNLDTCILEETNKKSLKISVTKLYGPSINNPGNFCIAGHNYRNNKMFGGIKKLEKGDEIILIDTFGDSIKYEVYKNYQTDPKDVTALNQETDGEREITLITCTAGAIKRVIVKAVEVYD